MTPYDAMRTDDINYPTIPCWWCQQLIPDTPINKAEGMHSLCRNHKDCDIQYTKAYTLNTKRFGVGWITIGFDKPTSKVIDINLKNYAFFYNHYPDGKVFLKLPFEEVLSQDIPQLMKYFKLKAFL